MADDLTPEQRAALEDAIRSWDCGGLQQCGRVYVGEHPDCTQEHRAATIDQLRRKSLLGRDGKAPMKYAWITAAGLAAVDGNCAWSREVADA